MKESKIEVGVDQTVANEPIVDEATPVKASKSKDKGKSTKGKKPSKNPAKKPATKKGGAKQSIEEIAAMKRVADIERNAKKIERLLTSQSGRVFFSLVESDKTSVSFSRHFVIPKVGIYNAGWLVFNFDIFTVEKVEIGKGGRSCDRVTYHLDEPKITALLDLIRKQEEPEIAEITSQIKQYKAAHKKAGWKTIPGWVPNEALFAELQFDLTGYTPAPADTVEKIDVAAELTVKRATTVDDIQAFFKLSKVLVEKGSGATKFIVNGKSLLKGDVLALDVNLKPYIKSNPDEGILLTA
jgi:hypothetical protein